MKRFLVFLTMVAAGCGPTTLRARLINAERTAGRAETLMDEADRAMAVLDPGAAEGRIRGAKDALAEPDVAYYPERDPLNARLAALEQKLVLVRAEKARQELLQRVGEQEEKVRKALLEFRTAVGNLNRKDVSDDHVDDAKDATSDVKDEIEVGEELETKDARYATFVRDAKKELEIAAPKLALAERIVAFVDGPCSYRREANEIAQKAVRERDYEERKSLLTDARGEYWRCGTTAKEMLAHTPALTKTYVLVDGVTLSPSTVAQTCTSRVSSMDKQIAVLSKLLAARKLASLKKRKR